MSKYQIKIKRDFGNGPGWWINGAYVKSGFVVVKNGCNCIPGAMWFLTIESAMDAIRAHINVGDTMEWHEEYKKIRSSKVA